uniref:Uncharacterized protein n=1 Tax=Rhizophagus irregularis (strain DAOM 181602 / DAOM 197198 / MUCL 43194) TaxID=747089 RepID=U9UQH7_RHIID
MDQTLYQKNHQNSIKSNPFCKLFQNRSFLSSCELFVVVLAICEKQPKTRIEEGVEGGKVVVELSRIS